jgi:hypothetical protein
MIRLEDEPRNKIRTRADHDVDQDHRAGFADLGPHRMSTVSRFGKNSEMLFDKKVN